MNSCKCSQGNAAFYGTRNSIADSEDANIDVNNQLDESSPKHRIALLYDPLLHCSLIYAKILLVVSFLQGFQSKFHIKVSPLASAALLTFLNLIFLTTFGEGLKCSCLDC
jgi:hypothetical protein